MKEGYSCNIKGKGSPQLRADPVIIEINIIELRHRIEYSRNNRIYHKSKLTLIIILKYVNKLLKRACFI